MRKILGSLAVAGWCAIIVLSVIPGTARPHTGAGGISEHFVAYAAVALLGGLATNASTGKVWIGGMLTLTAAALEILQFFIPGRNAELQGFFSGTLGCWSSILFLLLLTWAQSKSV